MEIFLLLKKKKKKALEFVSLGLMFPSRSIAPKKPGRLGDCLGYRTLTEAAEPD